MKKTLLICREWGGVIGLPATIVTTLSSRQTSPVEKEDHRDPGFSEVRTTDRFADSHLVLTIQEAQWSTQIHISYMECTLFFFINKCSELLISARSWRALNWYI